MIPRFNLDGIEDADGWWQVWTPPKPSPWQNVTVRWWHTAHGYAEDVPRLTTPVWSA